MRCPPVEQNEDQPRVAGFQEYLSGSGPRSARPIDGSKRTSSHAHTHLHCATNVEAARLLTLVNCEGCRRHTGSDRTMQAQHSHAVSPNTPTPTPTQSQTPTQTRVKHRDTRPNTHTRQHVHTHIRRHAHTHTPTKRTDTSSDELHALAAGAMMGRGDVAAHQDIHPGCGACGKKDVSVGGRIIRRGSTKRG